MNSDSKLHLVEDTKSICVDDRGLERVILNTDFMLGHEDGGIIPTYFGSSRMELLVTTSEEATQLAISSRAFTSTEAADFETISSKKNVRNEPMDWEGFAAQEKSVPVPYDVDDYVEYVMDSAISQPSKTESFLTLRDTVSHFPTEATRMLGDYLESNPNAQPLIDQLIFGALSEGFSPPVEELFLRLLSQPISKRRKSLLLQSISLVRGDKTTENIIREIQARASLSSVDGLAAMNTLSIMAGQLHHAGNQERAAPLIDDLEAKLLESETEGDEAKVLHVLNSLGNTHSRRGLPHLVKYLHPRLNSSAEARVYLHKAAAHALRGIKGDDVTDLLAESFSMHRENPEVQHIIIRSLSERKRSPNIKERLSYDTIKEAEFKRDLPFGDPNANLNLFTAVDYHLSYDATVLEAIAGVRAEIFGHPVKFLEGYGSFGSSGYTAFSANLYLLFEIENFIFGGKITYYILNWGIFFGAPLPINLNVDICTPPIEAGDMEPLFSPTRTLAKIQFTYGIPGVLGFDLSASVTGSLSVSYGYEFNFRHGFDILDWKNIQFHFSVKPGADIGALITGTGNAVIVKGGVVSKVSLMDLGMPINLAAILDGSDICQQHLVTAEFLKGDIQAFVSSPFFCLFGGPCVKAYNLVSWKGITYSKILKLSTCCGPEPEVSEDINIPSAPDSPAPPEAPKFPSSFVPPEFPNFPNNLRLRGVPKENSETRDPTSSSPHFSPPSSPFSPASSPSSPSSSSATSPLSAVENKRMETRVPGRNPIPNGDQSFRVGPATITWSYDNVTGVTRPVTASARIGNCQRINARRGICPGARATGPSRAVRQWLRGTNEYDGINTNAGHILAAAFGGSNSHYSNFFIQKAYVNQYTYQNEFEKQVRDCLYDNPSYYAHLFMQFVYLPPAATIKRMTPKSYIATARFTFQNDTLVPSDPITNAPIGCTFPYPNRLTLGQNHLRYEELANY